MLVGVLAMPDPAADPQHYSKPPAYPKPAPTYPTYKPSYKTVPAYPKPAQNKQPAYGQKYKSEYDYCDPRAPPTCSNNGTESICLKDEEYPEKEVQVTFKIIQYVTIDMLTQLLSILVRHRVRSFGLEEIRRYC